MKSFGSFMKGGLAAAMAFSMMACSSSSSSSSSAKSAATAASGTKAAIKLGGSGPLTGGAQMYGNAVKNAAEMAVKEINAQGGIQFELKFQDDEHDAEKAVNAYGILKDWGMQVSLGAVTSTPMAAVAPMYDEDNIFALTPSASSLAAVYADPTNETGAYGNVFQMCFTDPNQGVASAHYISQKKIGTNVAVIYKNDDTYSTGIYNKFTETAAEDGLKISYVGTFDDNNSQDFSVQLKQAQDAGADLLFLPIYVEPASLILTQANTMGYKPTFFGVDGMDGILGMENFDKSLAEGVYLLTPFSADAKDERTQNFVANYKAAYGEIPNQFAADAYDCVYAIKQACETAGITADMSASDICDDLTATFITMKYEGITGSSTWLPTGEVSKSPKAIVIKNGVYVSAEN